MSAQTTLPSITEISPHQGPTAGGTQLTIKGSGFSGATEVKFGNTQAPPIVGSVQDDQLKVLSPLHATEGEVNVQVNVSAGLSPVVPSSKFTYVAPTLESVSPSSGSTNGGTLITITGSGLANATAVKFGSHQASVSHASDTEVRATTPAGVPSGTVEVQVLLRRTGATATTSNAIFQFLPPSVNRIHPNSGPMSGGTKVTIHGNYLTDASSVQFGGTAATNPPNIISENEITVKTPAVTSASTVGVQVNIPAGLIPASASGAPQFTYSPPGPPVNAQFVIKNKTTIPDDLVFVKFLGAKIKSNETTQTYGDQQVLNTGSETANKSYSLAEMTSTTGITALNGPVPNFAINDYVGGRIYFSLVNKLTSTTPPAAQNPEAEDYSTVYGYVEPSVFPSLIEGRTNLDASYVDFVGLPFDIAIRESADGSLAHPPSNNPLSTPSGLPLFDALTSDTHVPPQTQVAAMAPIPASNSAPVTITGTARILSPSLYEPSLIAGAQSYHGWIASNELIGTFKTNATSLKVCSYVSSDTSGNMPHGTLFGFSGSTMASPISSAWVASQTYDLIATAVADLNPDNSNPRISQLQGVPGIILKGSGHSVGNFTIYLTNADLEATTGVYGANPPYVVDWTGKTGGAKAYSHAGIVNDLSGRVVGDLLAGFNFGWAACDTTVAEQANSNGTASNLTNTVFDVNSGVLRGAKIGALSTGQFFYLLSLQPTTIDVAKWFGSSIQPNNSNFYNNYASDFQSLTNCYNMAFTDRLQGETDPDMFFTPGPDTYVEITLLPGAYTVTQNSS